MSSLTTKYVGKCCPSNNRGSEKHVIGHSANWTLLEVRRTSYNHNHRPYWVMHAYITPLKWQLINVYVNITFHFPIITLVLSSTLLLSLNISSFLPSSFSPLPLNLHLVTWLLYSQQSLAGAKLNGFCSWIQHWSIWIVIRCIGTCHWLRLAPIEGVASLRMRKLYARE